MKKLAVALVVFLTVLLFPLIQTGCAIKHEVEVDPIEAEPIVVKFQLDTDNLEAFYEDLCLAQYQDEYLPSFADPNDPNILLEEDYVTECKNKKVAEFMDAFTAAVTKVTEGTTQGQ